MKIESLIATFLLISAVAYPMDSAHAAATRVKLCSATNGTISLKKRCRRGDTELNLNALRGNSGAPGTAGRDGMDGQNGADGVDGHDAQDRIYGDGSAGSALFAAASYSVLSNNYPDGNYQFTDFTIASGATVQVASGTVIRVNGNFINNGSLEVSTASGSYGAGLFFSGTTAGVNLATVMYDSPGASFNGDSASAGAYGDGSATRLGGRGGRPASRDEVFNLTHPGTIGGGGGSGGFLHGGAFGGGNVVILVKGTIVNSAGAAISANGDIAQTGTGGGGGGIIVLASATSISNLGVIQTLGGAGGGCTSQDAAAGGGGGGLVRMISPLITAGTPNVSGGVAGADCAPGTITGTTGNTRAGGAGGGGSLGAGGNGANALANGSGQGATDGGVGASIITQADPAAFF